MPSASSAGRPQRDGADKRLAKEPPAGKTSWPQTGASLVGAMNLPDLRPQSEQAAWNAVGYAMDHHTVSSNCNLIYGRLGR
jgi:hypothetical protein